MFKKITILNLGRFILLLACVKAGLTFAHLPALPTNNLPISLSTMLEQVTPAVVNIAVEKNNPPQLGPNAVPSKIIGVGSGVIIDKEKGYVVTNAHVVKNQALMVITLKDGRRFRGTLIGKDEAFDLAVIQIHTTNLLKSNITIANSDKLKVGDFAVAIGSPFGLNQTVTSGVISALNRSEPRIDQFQSFIQTDAPINPGNSGGALINLKGQLIGINTAIVSPTLGNSGIGFAIPSNMMKSVIEQLIHYGKVERGLLGLTAQNITPELAQALNLKYHHGAMVTGIIAGSAAEKANIKVEDIIEKINGVKIENAEQLHNMVALMRPHTELSLAVLRNHKLTDLSAVIGPLQLPPNKEVPFLSGLRLQDFSDLEPNGSVLKGVLVLNVADTSTAALSGVAAGDLILSANGKKTPTIESLLMVAKQPSNHLLLKVFRDDGQIFLVIQRNA